MEKFGIFELLDALAAITESSDAPHGAPENTQKASGEAPLRTPDDAFLSPTYGTEPQEKTGDAKIDAFGDFVARHDRAAERIGRPPRDK